MDLLNLPAGLALLAFVGAAAGVVAWNRSRRRAESPRDVDAAEELRPPTPLPTPAERAPAHQAAAKAAIEQAQARAAAQVAPVEAAPPAANAAPAAALARVSASASEPEPEPEPEPITQFDGPAWATTEPMPGIALEPQFADTVPAEMSFGATNFADTLVAELVAEELPSRVPGKRHRPA